MLKQWHVLLYMQVCSHTSRWQQYTRSCPCGVTTSAARLSRRPLRGSLAAKGWDCCSEGTSQLMGWWLCSMTSQLVKSNLHSAAQHGMPWHIRHSDMTTELSRVYTTSNRGGLRHCANKLMTCYALLADKSANEAVQAESARRAASLAALCQGESTAVQPRVPRYQPRGIEECLTVWKAQTQYTPQAPDT